MFVTLLNWNPLMHMESIKGLWTTTKTIAQVLWKNILVMNIQICIRSGGCFCYKRLQKPKVKNKGQRRGKLSLLLKSQTFLAINGLTIKSDMLQQALLEDLVLYIVKGYWPLYFVENPWLWHLVLWQCGHVQFPSHC